MHIETERLMIKSFKETMAENLFLGSLEDEMKKFLPDEILKNIEEAKEKIHFFQECYGKKNKPQVYAITLKDDEWIGYIQMSPLQEKWEIGYHILKKHTHHGYAKEAVTNFLPVMMKNFQINQVYGICLEENVTSCRILENCSFVKIFDGEDNYQGQKQNICKYIFYGK